MSEEHEPELNPISGNSPGEALRVARKRYGLSIEEVANELNLSIAQIRALEENRFEELPGKTYVQGYLKSYARLLNSDEADVLQNFSQQEDTNISGIRPVISEEQRSDRRVKVLGLGVILVLSGLMLAWWQNREQATVVPLEVGELDQQTVEPVDGSAGWRGPSLSEQPSDGEEFTAPGPMDGDYAGSSGDAPPVIVTSGAGSAASRDPTESLGVDDAEMPVATQSEAAARTDAGAEQAITSISAGSPEGSTVEQSSAALAVDEAEPAQSAAAEPQAAADTQAAAESDAVAAESQAGNDDQTGQNDSEKKIEETAVQEPASTAAPSTAEAEQSSVGEDGRLVKLRFNANSWVDLRDANGQRLLYENVNEGREISVQGNPPFRVFLGNAEGVQIDYAGKPFDFSAYTNGVYARFELGPEHGNQP